MANTKKTATKEVKAEVKAEAAEVKAAKAEPKAKTETKAKAEPKAKAAKTTAAKETIKCTIEFGGKNTTIESVVNNIKEAYKAEGNKAAIKTLDVYIQPENNVAYYVINGVEEGKSVSL